MRASLIQDLLNILRLVLWSDQWFITPYALWLCILLCLVQALSR